MSSTSRSEVTNEPDDMGALGYKQTLVREMASFSNFGVAFSIISVPTGLSQLFAYGLVTGGPAGLLWSSVVVGFFTTIVALNLAEICSTYPTAGGVYYWAFQLSPDGYKAWWAWQTAWFNILGQIAVTASVDFGLAITFASFLNLAAGFIPTPNSILGLYAMFIVIHGLMNLIPVKYIGLFNSASVVFHVCAILAIFITVLAVTPKLNTGAYVTTYFVNKTGQSDAYCGLIGALFAAYILTGYEACASMAEETKNASLAAPIGIVMSVACSYILIIFLTLGLLFSMWDYDGVVASAAPFTQLLVDAATANGAKVLLILIIACNFCCGFGCVTSASRIIYAFARDEGPPGSVYLSLLSQHQIPYVAVLAVVILAFAIGCTYLGSPIAFFAMTSLAVIGLSISYGIPIALRCWQGDNFVKNQFNLGAYGVPLGVVSVLWIGLLVAVFVMPTLYPVTALDMNYTCLLVGGVFLGATFGWLLGANKTFVGPPIAHAPLPTTGDSFVEIEKAISTSAEEEVISTPPPPPTDTQTATATPADSAPVPLTAFWNTAPPETPVAVN